VKASDFATLPSTSNWRINRPLLTSNKSTTN